MSIHRRAISIATEVPSAWSLVLTCRLFVLLFFFFCLFCTCCALYPPHPTPAPARSRLRLIICGDYAGNWLKFLNGVKPLQGDANPNVGAAIVRVRGQLRFVLFALRDIAKGDELIWDYGKLYFWSHVKAAFE